MKRVFVSSIIRGYEDYRAAARRGVEILGLEPVMAEDFPAGPDSPQEACLEGVRSSDVYVGILGLRYGDPTASGKSATEEEFEEAYHLGIPRLMFRTADAMDEAQLAFVGRLRGWEEGLVYASFGSPDMLKEEVIRALSEMGKRAGGTSAARGAALLRELLDRVPDSYEDVVVSLAIAPDSAGESLVRLDELDEIAQDVRTLVRQIDRFGGNSGQLIAKERSVEYGREPNGDGSSAFVEVFDDGRIVCSLGEPRTDRTDLAAAYIIDVRSMQSSLGGIVTAFSAILGRLDGRRRVLSGFIQGRLKGVKLRILDEVPDEPVSSFTIPMHQLPDPLAFPTEPVTISIRELGSPANVVGMLVATLKRQFNEALAKRV